MAYHDRLASENLWLNGHRAQSCVDRIDQSRGQGLAGPVNSYLCTPGLRRQITIL